jgi:hexosaminidase
MNQLIRSILTLATSLLLGAIALPQTGVQVDAGIRLIPQPLKVERGEGWFVLHPGVKIGAGCSDGTAKMLQQLILEKTGMELEITTPGTGIVVDYINLMGRRSETQDAEGYYLDISPDRIMVWAGSQTGFFYSIQTLVQLLPMERVISQPRELIRWVIPCVTIEDQPRFPWRGVMLDCSRTFQSTDYLKKTIRAMAFYKMNVLHLHLTDDQGWRLQLDAFPELTEKGAHFPDRYDEPESHQGFYTKDEIRDLIWYAEQRGITIVPEIEMPGHSLAALVSHPELACTDGPFEIHPFFKGPGIHADVFCPGKDWTFDFLESVLAEVVELFPSQYIHIGGDEVPKDRWKECKLCQQRIEEEGLADEHELQSWFMKRIEAILAKKKRTLIGWDEILEGGLAPNAAVMSWRGTKGGIAAARRGHDVVMSPTSHCYFDYSYERIDTKRAYSFEPVPEELDLTQASRILGLQANFWSHIDREPELVDRQLFPRLLAIAERGWSPAEVRDWENFRWRAKIHLVHLDELGIEYYRAPPSLSGPPIGSWSPKDVSEEYAPLTWDITSSIPSPGNYRVRFTYTFGSHRLGIEGVELLVNGEVRSFDHHRGVTGTVDENNEYVLQIDSIPEGATLTLRASARSEGGTDSNGEIYLTEEKN